MGATFNKLLKTAAKVLLFLELTKFFFFFLDWKKKVVCVIICLLIIWLIAVGDKNNVLTRGRGYEFFRDIAVFYGKLIGWR